MNTELREVLQVEILYACAPCVNLEGPQRVSIQGPSRAEPGSPISCCWRPQGGPLQELSCLGTCQWEGVKQC